MRTHHYMKLQMKLSYEAWVRKTKMSTVIEEAITKTANQLFKVALLNFNKFLRPQDGVPF